MMRGISFPQVDARDLDRRKVLLPGEWNVVIVAFRRQQQQEVAGSWVPWLEDQAAVVP